MALYGAHIVGVVATLIAIPYLARVLRPEGWGVVVFAQSFAAVLTLVLEYGFYLSATREIARNLHDRERVAKIVAEVQAAKLFLFVAVTVLTLVASQFIPLFRANPAHLLWAWVLAVSQGFSAFWFYQGVERPTYPAAAEALSKIVATVAVFVLVRDSRDGSLVLAIYGLAALTSAVATNGLIYRSVPVIRLRARAGFGMLRETFRLFVFRAASGSYSAANSFVLGAMAGPQVIAYFGGAERVVRGAINLIHPATQAIYPRVSHLMVHDREGAGRLLGLSMLLVGSLGVTIGAVGALSAPLLVDILLGDGYEPAVQVLRILSILPPVVAASTVLGLQWALPSGLDRPYFHLVIVGAFINLVLATVFVPMLGAAGMATSLVMAEVFVLVGLLLVAWRHGQEIWGVAFDSVFTSLRTRSMAPLGLDPRQSVGTNLSAPAQAEPTVMGLQAVSNSSPAAAQVVSEESTPA